MSTDGRIVTQTEWLKHYSEAVLQVVEATRTEVTVSRWGGMGQMAFKFFDDGGTRYSQDQYDKIVALANAAMKDIAAVLEED